MPIPSFRCGLTILNGDQPIKTIRMPFSLPLARQEKDVVRNNSSLLCRIVVLLVTVWLFRSYPRPLTVRSLSLSLSHTSQISDAMTTQRFRLRAEESTIRGIFRCRRHRQPPLPDTVWTGLHPWDKFFSAVDELRWERIAFLTTGLQCTPPHTPQALTVPPHFRG